MIKSYIKREHEIPSRITMSKLEYERFVRNLKPTNKHAKFYSDGELKSYRNIKFDVVDNNRQPILII